MDIVAFDRRFDRSSFSCGKPELDDWIKTKAGQQERSHNTRSFFAVEAPKVIGYYATTTYRLGLDDLAEMYGVGKFEEHQLHLFMPVKDLLATVGAQAG